jgi:hypothetical protein
MLCAEVRRDVSLEPFRDLINANKTALLDAISAAGVLDEQPTISALIWVHVYQGPVEGSVPPPDWDGALPEECGWPKICCVLGPCPRCVAGRPCRLDGP